MAANPNKTQTLTIPTEVVDSDWRDDIDASFAIYGNSEKAERTYIDPNKVITKETQAKIDRIKAKKIGVSVMEVLKDTVAA